MQLSNVPTVRVCFNLFYAAIAIKEWINCEMYNLIEYAATQSVPRAVHIS